MLRAKTSLSSWDESGYVDRAMTPGMNLVICLPMPVAFLSFLLSWGWKNGRQRQDANIDCSGDVSHERIHGGYRAVMRQLNDMCKIWLWVFLNSDFVRDTQRPIGESGGCGDMLARGYQDGVHKLRLRKRNTFW